jgi:protein-tyrosine kinase
VPGVGPSKPPEGGLQRILDPAVADAKRLAAAEVDSGVLRQKRVIAGLDDDDRVEPYRQLRTQLLKTMHDNKWNTLAVTSAHEGAGKSLTAVNLAISMSRDVNHMVLLVDLDLRTPTVHEKLGLHVEHALIDYLTGDVALEDVLAYPGYQRLVVLPGRALGKFSSEVLSSPQMGRFMSDIRGTYDPSELIIFDLPPLLRNDDALLFTPVADATLLVVEDGVTTNEQL